MSVSLPQSENHRIYPALNGLRGVLVLVVFAGHYQLIVSNFFDPAAWAVHCFFVLSGFLITGILYDSHVASNRWKTFYARRILRIFPLYYACLLLVVILEPVFRWKLHPSQWLWPLYLSNYVRLFWPKDMVYGVTDHFVSGKYRITLYFGHFWSLCVEEQFYLLWPIVVFLIRDRHKLMWICLSAICLVPLFRIWFQMYFEAARINGVYDRLMISQCDGLLLGALFALWMRGDHPQFRRLGYMLIYVIGSLVIVHYFIDPATLSRHEYDLPAAIVQSLVRTSGDVFGLGWVLLAVYPPKLMNRLLSSGIFYRLGTISYGFYVLHDIPHMLYVNATLRLPHPRVMCALLALVSTTLLSLLSFHYLEAPFLRMKKFFNLKSASSPKRLEWNQR